MKKPMNKKMNVDDLLCGFTFAFFCLGLFCIYKTDQRIHDPQRVLIAKGYSKNLDLIVKKEEGSRHSLPL